MGLAKRRLHLAAPGAIGRHPPCSLGLLLTVAEQRAAPPLLLPRGGVQQPAPSSMQMQLYIRAVAGQGDACSSHRLRGHMQLRASHTWGWVVKLAVVQGKCTFARRQVGCVHKLLQRHRPPLAVAGGRASCWGGALARWLPHSFPWSRCTASQLLRCKRLHTMAARPSPASQVEIRIAGLCRVLASIELPPAAAARSCVQVHTTASTAAPMPAFPRAQHQDPAHLAGAPAAHHTRPLHCAHSAAAAAAGRCQPSLRAATAANHAWPLDAHIRPSWPEPLRPRVQALAGCPSEPRGAPLTSYPGPSTKAHQVLHAMLSAAKRPTVACPPASQPAGANIGQAQSRRPKSNSLLHHRRPAVVRPPPWYRSVIHQSSKPSSCVSSWRYANPSSFMSAAPVSNCAMVVGSGGRYTCAVLASFCRAAMQQRSGGGGERM